MSAAAEALLTVTVVCEPFSKSATTASVAGCVCAKRRDDVPASSNKADKDWKQGITPGGDNRLCRIIR